MIRLVNKGTRTTIGAIDENDFNVLQDSLVEESEADKDYYINRDTLDLLKERGASDSLVRMLTDAIGESGGVEIEWDRG